jgi:GDP-4-dehydro-6-deoxy-D-mannose reductase
MVRAYYLAVLKCQPGEVYNIATGTGKKIKDVLDLLLSFSKVKIKVLTDKTRMRPSDVEVLIGDATKFKKKTGWKPAIPFEKTMRDLLDYWRKAI